MGGVFITGTDTGVGKSVITGLLARYLSEAGYSLITQKWVQTGSERGKGDIKVHLQMMGKKKEFFSYLPQMLPYTFTFPSSPHLSARLENKRIDVRRIRRSFTALVQKFEFVLVEGTGGVLVPLSKRSLLIDIARDFHLPVILVIQNRLGAINHSLLSIEAVRARRMGLIGVIFNNLAQSKRENPLILEDNVKIIKAMGRVDVLGSLPYSENLQGLYEEFKPIGARVEARLCRSR